jgi:chromosomal replication initiation ATPase DnaA
MREPELRELLEAIVAGGFDIEEDRLRLPSRGFARTALARQAAMYLAHVVCSLTKAEAGRLFERDRTTVHHACLVIEQRRDDDDFNLALDYLERILRIVVGPQEVACHHRC